MLARYLALILDYLVHRIGLEVLDWSLRQVIAWFDKNPESDKACSTASIERYLSDHDPDIDGFFWENKH